MIKINKKWETLISLIIWVFIISLIIHWIVEIISSNYIIEDNFIKNNKIFFLKNNTTNIINSLNIKWTSDWEIYYLYKDEINKTFTTYTGVLNEKYKYVDEYWNNILDIWHYDKNFYLREIFLQNINTSIWIQNQIIKISVKEILKN